MSILPYFVCTIVFLAYANTSLFDVIDAPSNKGSRAPALDGLRGFLALGVFVHHAVIYQTFADTGSWSEDIPRFYMLLGKIGVSFFFMITGYLFWAKSIKENGRIDRTQLIVGRLFRIAPVYLITASGAIIAIAAMSGWTLKVSQSDLAIQIARWVSLGIFQPVETNAVEGSSLVLAGVTWSLAYEWGFYVSILILSVLCRQPIVQKAFVLGGFLISLVVVKFAVGAATTETAVSLFFAGALCASFYSPGLTKRVPAWIQSVAAVILMVLLFAKAHTGFSVPGIVVLASAFFLFVHDASLFGLLTSKPAKRLRHVSYPVYLAQGLVLLAIFSLPNVATIAAMNEAAFTIVACATGLVLISVSSVVHVYVENPGIRLGRSVSQVITKTTVAPREASR